MLEYDCVLRTWRLDNEPLSSNTILATPISDHRLHYLEYEGPVSGGRGSVLRWDHGEYEVISESDVALVMRLRGEVLNGVAELLTNAEETRFVFTPSV